MLIFSQQNTRVQNKIKKKYENVRTYILEDKEKTTGSVMINIFLNISLKPEGILHHLCKLYTVCTECRGCYNFKDSEKVLREDFCFGSLSMLFHIFGPR